MENTVEQMEIMALDTKIGTDTLDAVRKMIPEDRKLNLEKVMWELKNSSEGSVPNPEHAVPYTGWMAIAEIMVRIMNRETKELDDRIHEKSFSELRSFYASRAALLALQTYLSLTVLYSREQARKIKWNGWPSEEKWEQWQEHMEALTECITVLLGLNREGAELCLSGIL